MTSAGLEQVKNMVKEIFMELSDNKKTINREQLSVLFKTIGIHVSSHEMEQMCHSMNVGKKDPIAFPALINTIEATIKKIRAQDELPEVFKGFDMDRDGFIAKSELKVMLRNVGVLATDKDLDLMMRSVLARDEDKIDYERFVQIVHDCTQDRSATPASLSTGAKTVKKPSKSSGK